MKKICLILLGLLTIYPLSSCLAQEKEIDRIIAVVNEEAITKNEFEAQAKVIKSQLIAAGVPVPKPSLFNKRVLQDIINQKLQLQAAHNMEIQISESELNQAIKQIAERNNVTVKELYNSLPQKGLTIADFKKEIRNEMLIQKFQESAVASRISISQAEIDNFTQPNQENLSIYRVGDILISLPSDPSPSDIDQAKQQAVEILNRLKKGADFKQEAMNLSYDLALKGGDLGWRKLPELPEAFADAIKNMHVGDLSGPIRTPNGFHIIKLLDLKSNLSSKKEEEVELQVIFISQTNTQKGLSDNSAYLIKKISQSLKNGSDFASLAKKYSQDKTTASQGGYKGWVYENSLDPVLRQAVEKMAVSQISEPLQTKEGWTFIKILAKRQVQKFSSLEKSKVQQLIFQRKIAEGIEALINNLRDEAYIKIFDPQFIDKE